MSEALETVLNFGFKDLHLQEIVAMTNKFNENSKGLLLKHNFVLQEGVEDEGFPENLVFSLKNKISSVMLMKEESKFLFTKFVV